LILHTPAPSRFDQTVQAHKALETLLAEKKVRAIGVSNSMPHHLNDLLAQTDVVPGCLQWTLMRGGSSPSRRLSARPPDLGNYPGRW